MDIIDSLFEKSEYINNQQRKFIFCLVRQIYEASEANKKDIFGKNLDAYKDIEDIRQGLQNKFLEFEGIIPKDLEPLKGIDDFINKNLKLSDRIYICPDCGNEIDRDYQASLNLKQYGENVLQLAI